jgi:hypothetical protein
MPTSSTPVKYLIAENVPVAAGAIGLAILQVRGGLRGSSVGGSGSYGYLEVYGPRGRGRDSGQSRNRCPCCCVAIHFRTDHVASGRPS